MKIKSLFILLFLSVFTFAHAQLTDYSIFDKKFELDKESAMALSFVVGR